MACMIVSLMYLYDALTLPLTLTHQSRLVLMGILHSHTLLMVHAVQNDLESCPQRFLVGDLICKLDEIKNLLRKYHLRLSREEVSSRCV